MLSSRLGLGAPTTDNLRDSSRREASSSEKLRRQLLGHNPRKMTNTRNAPGSHIGQKERQCPERTQDQNADSDPDEESRSSLGKRKRRDTAGPAPSGDTTRHLEDREPAVGKSPRRRAKGSSYLDELLSKRSRRKGAT
jgi:hypothetical protein